MNIKLYTYINHSLDVRRRQAIVVVGDGDLIFIAGPFVFGGHMKDPVDVDLKGDLDLRNASGRRRNAGQVEFAEQVVVLGHRPFALEYLNGDRRLIVGGGREDL